MGYAQVGSGNLEDADNELFRDEAEVAAVTGVRAVVAHEETVVLTEGVAAQRDSVQQRAPVRPDRTDTCLVIDYPGIMCRIDAVHRDGHPLVRNNYRTEVLDGPVVGLSGELAGSEAPALLEHRVRSRT